MSAALLLGVVLAVACLAYVLYPLVAPGEGRSRAAAGDSKGPRAVTDEEIEAAIRSYREAHVAGRVECPACGPRPESDPVFCSTCGRPLDGRPGPP